MRIWSLHPQYLDTKGLVALWRETLLAKHVLEGKTKGYLNHPQLNRFKAYEQPLEAINYYLSIVHEEAIKRNYNFDAEKFKRPKREHSITVTKGQINYESEHLLKKLKIRDTKLYKELKDSKRLKPHPLFRTIKGDIEPWEVLS
jgi:hypothetical protein